MVSSFSGEKDLAGKRTLFADDFSSSTLSHEWTVQADQGNDIEVRSGDLHFKARPGSKAHIERSLGPNTLRVSCEIEYGRPAAPVALRLIWDASNFAQIGLNDDGRLMVREALGTYPHDYELNDPAQDGGEKVGMRSTASVLAIEIAEDCIRYFVGKPGKTQTCVHVSRRPERFAKPAKLLAIGLESGTKLFPPANPWIRRPIELPMGSCVVGNVVVSELPQNAQKASGKDKKIIRHGELDLIGQTELGRRADPAFESICTNLPALKWPREAIGVMENPIGIGVAADGSLQFGPDIANYNKAVAYFAIDGYRFGSHRDACKKELVKGYMPIVICKEEHDGLQLEQTVFGYSKGFSPDETLFAYVRLAVSNSGANARQVHVELKTGAGGTNGSPLAWTLELPARSRKTVEVRIASDKLEVAEAGMPAKGSAIGRPITRFSQPPESIARQVFDETLQQTKDYWERLLARASRFEIPETRVQNAYRAWIAYNLINVSKRGDVYHVCDGSGFYSRIYGYSAALYCNNMDLLGCHDLSTRYMESLLTLVQTNGLLAVNFGSTDTGAALWAIAEHYWITRDADWIRKISPKMLRMCGWIIDQRNRLKQSGDNDPRTKGLIRYKPYADLLHPAADYFSNSYLQKGLAAAAAVFEALGMHEDATRLKREADEYLADIKSSMDKSVFIDDGMQILPAIPDSHELWKEANGSANGYYGIIVPMMLEAGIPAATDAKADLLVRALETRGGLISGICRFHNMADHAYAYGYWMSCLERDEVRKAILGLYSSMAFGMSRDTFSAVECTHILTGENYWTLPHTYSNTQQLRLLRNMLLREEGTKLLLAQATPRPWLAPGQRVSVNKAPTIFGPMSYSIEVTSAREAKVRIAVPERNVPQEVVLCLRHPEFRRVLSISGNKPAGLQISGEKIRFKPGTDPVEFTVQFK